MGFNLAAVLATAASMLPTAFIAGRPAGETVRVPRHAVEALPAPMPSSAAHGASTSGWTQLAAAGALAAAAFLRAGKRRSRAAPAAGSVMSGHAVLSGGQLVPNVHLGFASRGQAEETSTGRASRVIAHVRVRKGMYTKWRRRDMWLKYSKTFTNRRRNCFRIAKQAVMHALKAKYRSRRWFKRERRRLWILRVNANSRLHGIKYSKFISKMKEANININRKILSQLGVYDRAVFTNIMEVAIPDWKQLKQELEDKYIQKNATIEELDDHVIPYLEARFPNLYTDPTMRFNRKEHGWGVEYTIDIGKAEDWQEVLPKHPDMANFNIPDHWVENAREQFQEVPLSLAFKVPKEEEDSEYAKFMGQVRANWAEDEEKEKQGIAVPRKEGVSRDDWFAEEPQSWF